MELLGDRNWWTPKRLGRILPVDVEGRGTPVEDFPEEDREREPELV